jgi:hypothetical protein
VSRFVYPLENDRVKDLALCPYHSGGVTAEIIGLFQQKFSSGMSDNDYLDRGCVSRYHV